MARDSVAVGSPRSAYPRSSRRWGSCRAGVMCPSPIAKGFGFLGQDHDWRTRSTWLYPLRVGHVPCFLFDFAAQLLPRSFFAHSVRAAATQMPGVSVFATSLFPALVVVLSPRRKTAGLLCVGSCHADGVGFVFSRVGSPFPSCFCCSSFAPPDFCAQLRAGSCHEDATRSLSDRDGRTQCIPLLFCFSCSSFLGRSLLLPPHITLVALALAAAKARGSPVCG